MTAPLERVLRAFLDDPAAARYGYDLMKAASLQSGTLYPLLARLEQHKLVISAWETPQQEGQRPRKYYRLTGEGIRIARLELARASRPQERARPPRPPGTREPRMRGERGLLRVGEYLVGRACRRLPREIREDRYREWTAELPAILHDPQIRPAPHRAVRMLGYAADTLRGTALARGRAGRRAAVLATIFLGLVFVATLPVVAWNIRDTVRAPEHWVNYLRVTWSLLLAAWPVSQFGRPAARVTWLIPIGGCLAGLAVNIWSAVQAPADWVNYFAAVMLFLMLLAWWDIRRGPASAIARAAGSKIRHLS